MPQTFEERMKAQGVPDFAEEDAKKFAVPEEAKQEWAYADKLAEILATTPDIGLGEQAAASQTPPELRALVADSVRKKFAKEQPSKKKLGGTMRLGTSVARGMVGVAAPRARAVGLLPTLDPEQEKFANELTIIRQSEDPLKQPGGGILGALARGTQSTAEMTMPMLDMMGTAAQGGLVGGALAKGMGLGKVATAAAVTAGGKIGTTAAGLPQIADQLHRELILEGHDPNRAWWTTLFVAPVESAIESLQVFPFRGAPGVFRGAAMQVARKVLLEFGKRYAPELAEEGLQAGWREAGKEVARALDEEIPNKGLGSVVSESWKAVVDSALPLALMLAPGGARLAAQGGMDLQQRGAAMKEAQAARPGLQARRTEIQGMESGFKAREAAAINEPYNPARSIPNRVATQLEAIRAKGFVSTEDGKSLGLTEDELTNRKTRLKAVDDRIAQLTQEKEDARAISGLKTEVREEPSGGDLRGEGKVEVPAKPTGEVTPAPEVPVAKSTWEMTRAEFVTARAANADIESDEYTAFHLSKVATGEPGLSVEGDKIVFRNDAGEPIGVTTMRTAAGEKVIDSTAVRPDSRRKGVATSLYEKAAELGYTAGWVENRASASAKHKMAVKQAIADGKPVPAEVMEEYPDLAPAKAPPAPKTAAERAFADTTDEVLLPLAQDLGITATDRAGILAEMETIPSLKAYIEKNLEVKEKAPEAAPPPKVGVKGVTKQPEKPYQKEPWQMTREEWADYRVETAPSDKLRQYKTASGKYYRGSDQVRREAEQEWFEANEKAAAEGKPVKKKPAWMLTQKQEMEQIGNGAEEHRMDVERAIKLGYPVPAEVLAEYPDLQAKPAPIPKVGKKGVTKQPAPAVEEKKAEPSPKKVETGPIEFAEQSKGTNAPGVKRTFMARAGERVLMLEQGKHDSSWSVVEKGQYTGELKGKVAVKTEDKVLASGMQDARKAKDVATRIFRGTFDSEADLRFVKEDTTDLGETNSDIAKRIKGSSVVRVGAFAALLRESGWATDGRMLVKVTDKDRDAILAKVGKTEGRAVPIDKILEDAEKVTHVSSNVMTPIAYRGGDITERTVALQNKSGEVLEVSKTLHDTVMKKHPDAVLYGPTDTVGGISYTKGGQVVGVVMPLKSDKPDAHLQSLMKGTPPPTAEKPSPRGKTKKGSVKQLQKNLEKSIPGSVVETLPEDAGVKVTLPNGTVIEGLSTPPIVPNVKKAAKDYGVSEQQMEQRLKSSRVAGATVPAGTTVKFKDGTSKTYEELTMLFDLDAADKSTAFHEPYHVADQLGFFDTPDGKRIHESLLKKYKSKEKIAKARGEWVGPDGLIAKIRAFLQQIMEPFRRWRGYEMRPDVAMAKTFGKKFWSQETGRTPAGPSYQIKPEEWTRVNVGPFATQQVAQNYVDTNMFGARERRVVRDESLPKGKQWVVESAAGAQLGDIRQSLVSAIQSVRGESGRATLADVREALSGYSREAVDAELEKMERSGDIVLYPADHPAERTQRVQDAALKTKIGNERHFVYLQPKAEGPSYQIKESWHDTATQLASKAVDIHSEIDLPDLYQQIKEQHPQLTVEEFKKGMLELRDQGRIRLLEYTRAPADVVDNPATIQVPPSRTLPYGALLYHVRAGTKAGPSYQIKPEASEEQQLILDTLDSVAADPDSHWDENRIFISDVIASSGMSRESAIRLLTDMRSNQLIQFSQVDLVESGTPAQRAKMATRIPYKGAEYNLIRLSAGPSYQLKEGQTGEQYVREFMVDKTRDKSELTHEDIAAAWADIATLSVEQVRQLAKDMGESTADKQSKKKLITRLSDDMKQIVDVRRRFGDSPYYQIQPGESMADAIRREYLGQQKAEAKKQPVPPGRPDLANPATPQPVRDLVDVVDTERNKGGRPKVVTREETDAQAEKLLADDYDGQRNNIIRQGQSGGQLNSAETAAAKKILNKEGLGAIQKGDQTSLTEAMTLIEAYRNTGSEQARAFGQRFDPLETPAERYARAITESILEPPSKDRERRNRARREGNHELADRINKEWADKIAALKTKLKKVGIDLDNDLNPTQPKAPPVKGEKAVKQARAKKAGADFLAAFRRVHPTATTETQGPLYQLTPEQEAAADLLKSATELVRAQADLGVSSFKAFVAGLKTDGIYDSEMDAVLKQAWDQVEAEDNAPAISQQKAAEIVRAVDALKSTYFDKMTEYWISGILSAPTTQAANIFGNTFHAAWSFTAERLMEATANLAMKRPEGAQLGEFKYLLAGVLPGISRGAKNFLMSWDTELPMLEVQLGRGAASKLDKPRTAIGGRTGRIVRIPLRLLQAVDDFCKSVFVEMESGAQAYRIAKAEGVQGEALQSRVAELLGDIESPAWDAAYDSALELAFQQKGGKTVQTIKKILLGARNEFPALNFLIPFVSTPMNIFGTGIKKSPLGTVNIGLKMYRNYRDGNHVLTGLPPLVAQQVLAWAVVMALLGNDDDDPWITGAEKATGRGSKEVSYRTQPAMSVKIGDTWWSYSRLEPFATVIGLTVDFVNAIKSGDTQRMATSPPKTLLGQVQTKTFMSGIGSIITAATADDPVEGIAKWSSDFTTSWVPNIVRSVSRESDAEYMNRRVWGKGADWWKMLMKRTGQKTEVIPIQDYPNYDVWGRPAKRSESPVGADWLYRIMIPIRNQKDETFVADRLIMNWNNAHPGEEARFPQTPMPYYRSQGETIYMTPQQMAEFTRLAGESARIALSDSKVKLNADDPTPAALDWINDISTETRAQVREKLVAQWESGSQEGVDPKEIANAAVDKMIGRLAYAGTAPIPKRKDYKSDETYQESLQKRQNALGRLQEMVPSIPLTDAQKTLRGQYKGSTPAYKARRAALKKLYGR